MALTTAERTNIIKLVVAMFDVAPGATYLADITVAYEANGRSLAQLARTLTDISAYKTLNPVSQTAAEFAKNLLTPLGLQDNAVANDFVAAKFNAGVSKGQIAYDVAVALDATTDPVFRHAQILLANKVQVAEYFSVTKAIAVTDMTKLHAVIDDVRVEYSSVDAALRAVDDGTYFQSPTSNPATGGTTGGTTTGTPPGTTKPPTTGGTTSPPNTSPPDSSPGYYPADDPPPAGSGGTTPPVDPWSDSEHMGPPPPPPPDPMDPMAVWNPPGLQGLLGLGFEGGIDPAASAQVQLVGLGSGDLFGAMGSLPGWVA